MNISDICVRDSLDLFYRNLEYRYNGFLKKDAEQFSVEDRGIMNTENPLERVLEVIDALEHQQADVHLNKVWNEIHAIYGDSSTSVKEFVNSLAVLVRESELALMAIDQYDQDLKNVLSDALYSFRKLIYKYGDNVKWSQVKPDLTRDTVIALKMASATLGTTMNSRLAEKEDLDKIITEATELSSIILNSDINDHLKGYLLEHVEMIRMAASAYIINGADGLRHASEASIGFFVFNADKIRSEKTNESIFKKAFTLVTRAGAVAQAGDRVLELAEKIEPLLDKAV